MFMPTDFCKIIVEPWIRQIENVNMPLLCDICGFLHERQRPMYVKSQFSDHNTGVDFLKPSLTISSRNINLHTLDVSPY